MEITLSHKNNHKKRTKYEAQIENLEWKLRFHEEQIQKTKKQIKRLKGEIE